MNIFLRIAFSKHVFFKLVSDCFLLLLLLLLRTERSAHGDAGEVDSRACKKAMCLPWVVMRFFVVLYFNVENELVVPFMYFLKLVIFFLL